MSEKPVFTYVLIAVLVLAFTGLVSSLYMLQIRQVSKYRQIAENNYVRVRKIKPVRGQILDQKYRPIATNAPTLNLYYKPWLMDNETEVATFLAGALGDSVETFTHIFKKNRWRFNTEVLLAENLQWNDWIYINERLNYYPALAPVSEPSRNYLLPNHFTGYVGRLNEREYKSHKDMGYDRDERIGKTGLERQYEQVLRGSPGYRVMQVDARGKSFGFFTHNLEKLAENGSDIVLFIDKNLQQKASELIPEGLCGAICVIDVRTGGIMAYASQPAYDPNLFGGSISQALWDSLTTSPSKPMLDRLIGGTYPPGSVFKPITGSLALQQGVVTPTEKLSFCSGSWMLGSHRYNCWNPSGHGRSNFYQAMAASCDVYYYDLSTRLKLDDLRQFVLGNHLIEKTGIDLPGERRGFFPDNNWYVRNYGRYYGARGHMVNLSIGQGEVLVTPLQVCAYYAALANNAVWQTPHFLDKTLGNKEFRYSQTQAYPLPIKPQVYQVLKQALHDVIEKPGGTGNSARVYGVDIYGKSGSAENHQGDLTHAWFAGWAQWDTPEIAFVIFLENAGHGGSVAAPLAKQLIKYYTEHVRAG